MMDKNKLEDKNLEQVDGGGLFSGFSDEEYNDAGVTVIGSGFWYNDGYEFQGKKISTDEANMLALFTVKNGRAAVSIDEAREFAETQPDLYIRL